MVLSWQLQVFALLLAIYHASEFTLAAVFMRQHLGWSCESWNLQFEWMGTLNEGACKTICTILQLI